MYELSAPTAFLTSASGVPNTAAATSPGIVTLVPVNSVERSALFSPPSDFLPPLSPSFFPPHAAASRAMHTIALRSMARCNAADGLVQAMRGVRRATQPVAALVDRSRHDRVPVRARLVSLARRRRLA